MNNSLKRLLISTGILVAGFLLGITVPGFGIVFMIAGVLGFIFTGGVQAVRDTFFTRL